MIQLKRLLILVSIILSVSRTALSQFNEYESVNFQRADSIADLYNGFDLHDQKKLAELLTGNLTSDVEKFRAIFKWITNNISYDLDLLKEKNDKEQKLRYHKKKLERWQKRFNKKITTRLVVSKRSICDGYSTLLSIMCELAGIQCEKIEGYGRTTLDKIGYGKIDHAWNAVYLNSKWNLCDPTWASGYVNFEVNKFRKEFDKNYFLTDPSLFIANHYPKNSSWILLYNKPTWKDFLDSPHKPSGFIANKLNHYKPEAGRMKVKSDSSIRFAFTSNLPANSIKTVIIEAYKKNKGIYTFQKQKEYNLSVDKEGYYYFEHAMNEVGEFKVRIFIKRRLSFIYEVSFK